MKSKLNACNGDALAKLMLRKSDDKKSKCVTMRKPLVYDAISTYRSAEQVGLFKSLPIGARPPHWTTGPDSATEREERLAMLVDGPLRGTWRECKPSGTRLDREKHAETIAKRLATARVWNVVKQGKSTLD